MNLKKLPALFLLAFVLSVQGNILIAIPKAPADQVEVIENDSIANEKKHELINLEREESIDDDADSKSSYNLIFYLIYQFLKNNPLTTSR